MRTRIIINGAAGKMGKLAHETLENHLDFELVACCTRGDDLGNAIRDTKADAVIDVTEPSAVFANTMTILEHKVRPIIGTSGLTEKQIQEIASYCEERKIGAIIAPNFSIGALMMMHCAKQVARFMPECEIIEMHHPHKKDAPSGTALKTAQLIAQSRQYPPATRTSDNPALGYLENGVPIHSLRLPGVLADQSVLFGNTGETFSLQHRTLSRDAFKPGILLACQKIMALEKLVYGLEEFLFES